MGIFTQAISEMRELNAVSVCLRIVTAVLLGGVNGFERGVKNRPAGLRTYMLVSLGACVVMMTNQYVYQVYHTGDLVRMGAQVVSGIGFLGAGTIIVTSRNQIKGLTTAAGLWAAAGVGLAVGIGAYEIAVPGAITISFVFTILHKWDFHMRRNTKIVDVYVELSKEIPLGNFMRYIRAHNIEPSNIQLEHDNVLENNAAAFIVTLKGKSGHDTILTTAKKMEGIIYLEEL